MELMDVYSVPSLHKQVLVPRGRCVNVKELASDTTDKVNQLDHAMEVEMIGKNDS